MIIIPNGTSFLSKGAIVPSEAELEAMIHALREERDRIVRAGGDCYSKMSLEEVAILIKDLLKYKAQRGV